ncbi:MAG: efflux RND transporter periplasmic adaptor subunit [Terriglobia bacterium]
MKPVYTRSSTESPGLSTATPAHSPEPPLQAIQPSQPGKSRLWLVAGAIILAIVIIVLIRSALRNRQAASTEAGVIQTEVVQRAEFVKRIRLSGTMEAVESYSVVAPPTRGTSSGPLMLTQLDAGGTKVKKGDVVAEFDPQVEIQNYLTAKAAYQGLVDQITAKKADEAAAKATDNTNLMQAEDALKKAQLEILKDPILSPNDVKTNQLNLDEATAKLKQFKVTYALKRQSALADIRDFEIQAEMKRLDMLQAQQNEKVMVVHSPADGIVVINSTWKGNGMGPFEVGDSLRPGQPFVRIVNPAHMQALIDVNQLDYPFIHAGQSAVFHLDAYPGTAFPGTLESVSPIANASDFSDKVRTLTALAEVQGSDPRLMPDLSAAVDVQIEKLPDALVIPRGSIVSDHGKTYVLLKSGLGFDRHQVKLGPVNDTQAVIESGLHAGNVVKKTVASDK